MPSVTFPNILNINNQETNSYLSFILVFAQKMRLPFGCCPRYCLTPSQEFSFSQSLVPCLRVCDEHSHYSGYKTSVSL